MGILKLPCGCEFQTVGSEENIECEFYNEEIHPKVNLDIYNIPETCPTTWRLISEGNVKSVFQLESQLGKTWAKKLKPNSIELLSALIAIIRPGTLKGILDGKSMTQHFVDRKNYEEEITYLHESLKPILEKTYGIIIYQESSILISVQIGGFNPQQADILRRGIGHKESDTMDEVEKDFINGCKITKVVDEEMAEKIFGFIRKSERYSFNKSHSVSYSKNAYITAYLKTHFSRQFFCSYLNGAKWKQDPHQEISEIINDAKLNDIIINPPSLPRLNDVPVIHNKEIYYSLGSIRQIGDKALAKLIKTTRETENSLNKKAEDWGWLDFLLYLSPQNNIAAMIALIQSGSLDYFKVQRSKMLFELKDIWIKLTEKEQQWCKTQYNNYRECELHELLNECARPRKEGGGCSNINRIRIVGDLSSLCEKPPYELKDSLDSIIWGESQYLGIPMSAHATDKYEDSMVANTTCKELLKSPREYSVLSVQIKDIREVKTKRGKNPGQRMAFMVVEDSTSQIDGVVVFPDQYKEYENFLEVDNVILLRLEKSKKGSHILKKAQILE